MVHCQHCTERPAFTANLLCATKIIFSFVYFRCEHGEMHSKLHPYMSLILWDDTITRESNKLKKAKHVLPEFLPFVVSKGIQLHC